MNNQIKLVVTNQKKCSACNIKKDKSDYSSVDFPVFREDDLCKICRAKMNENRKLENAKFTKNQEQIKKEFIAGGGVLKPNVIGRSSIVVKDKLITISEGQVVK